MNKYSYLGMAAVAMTLAACSNEDVFEGTQTLPGKQTVKAFMGNDDTRVSAENDEANNKHVLTWMKDDKIGVWNGSVMTEMTLTEGSGTKAGVFTAASVIEGDVTTAVYPYNEAHAYADGTWTMKLPAEYDFQGAYTGNVNSPMVATVAASEAAQADATVLSDIHFSHVAGAIRFDILSLPADAAQVVLTLPGKKIAGEFAVADGMIANAESSNEAEQSVAIKFSQNDSEVQQSTFFFPVPVGDYTSLKLEVKDENGNVLNAYENPKAFTIKRADMALYPVITIGGEAEDLYAAAENGGTFTLGKDMTVKSFEVTATDLTIDLNGHTLSCAAEGGNVIIVNKGKLTVKDSSDDKNGQITAQVSIGYAPSKEGYDGGEFVLESGTVTGGADNARVVVGKNGKFTMKGGNVINTGYNFAIGTNNLSNSSDASISLYSGTVESKEDYAIFVADNVKVSINESATVKGKRGCIAIDKGSLEIFNGTFESECLGEPTGTSGSGSFPGAIIAAPAYYDNVSVKIYGGTFNGKNGVSTEKLGDRVSQGADYSTTMEVRGGKWNDPEVLNYAKGNDYTIEVTMVGNKEITKAIRMSEGKAIVDFNGQTLSNKQKGNAFGFKICGSANVTFKDENNTGGITIDGSEDTEDHTRMALFIYDNANVTIEGGKYYNTQQVNEQIDLIQVGGGNNHENDQAKLTINGGIFESGCFSTFGNKNPRYWVANVHNKCNLCSIEVMGGSFINYNPAKPGTDDKESYLADGYKVTVSGKDNADVTKAYYEEVADDENKPKLTYTVTAE